MTAYYNEFDPFAAAWLRELIKEGHIAYGEVDERDIKQVTARDLRGFTQCHFFAGIGGWSLALRLAGWPDEKSVWTGSCPCQPFSSAGRQKGKADDRHLWPVWERLIRECRPATIFGEQVASAIAHGWLDDVYQGLEALGYAVGSAILPACSVGAPHKRDRLWFVGVAHGSRLQSRKQAAKADRYGGAFVAASCVLGYPQHNGSLAVTQQRSNGASIQHNTQGQDDARKSAGASFASDVADSFSDQKYQEQQRPSTHERRGRADQLGGCGMDSGERLMAGAKKCGRRQRCSDSRRPSQEQRTLQKWGRFTDSNTVICPDGKQRLVEPSICLLVDGVSNRVGKLRGYGNAIVPEAAAEFIGVFADD